MISVLIMLSHIYKVDKCLFVYGAIQICPERIREGPEMPLHTEEGGGGRMPGMTPPPDQLVELMQSNLSLI